MRDMKKNLLLLLLLTFFYNCEMQPKSYKFGIPEEDLSQILYGLINSSSSVTSFSTETTYGTMQFASTRLEWKRCAQGQVYRSAQKDCQGTTSPSIFTPNDLKYGATRHAYCNSASNTCNSLELIPILNSTLTSTTSSVTAYATCNADTTGVSSGVTAGSWRVPTIVELKALAALGRVATLKTFPDAPDEIYWSSSSEVENLKGETGYAVDFSPEVYGNEKKIKKDTKLYIRCVRSY
jgi:hypothetical protein